MVVQIQFSVVCETAYGEGVYIAGNVPSLGSWIPNRALPLYTTKDLYPQWKSKAPIQISPGKLLEFKIVILNKAGKIVRWEQIGSNRSLVITSSVLIGMEEGKSQMSFQNISHIHQINEMGPGVHQQQKRRGTVDIINDLSDYSESSSGNQSHFWNQKLLKSSKNTDLTEQFLIHSKIVTDNWLRDQKSKTKTKSQRSFKFKQKHIYLKKTIEGPMKKLSKSYYNDFEDKKMNIIDSHEEVQQIFFNRVTELKQELLQKKNQGFESVDLKSSGAEKIQKINWKSKDLQVYHINAEDATGEIVHFLMKKMYSYVVVYYNEDTSLCREIDYDPNFIIIRRRKILEKILVEYQNRGWNLSLLKQRKLILTKGDATIIVLFENADKTDEQDAFRENQKNELSTGPISHLIYNIDQLLLPAPFRLTKLFQPKILKNLSMRKIILIINCEKIQTLPQKIINDLIHVTSKNSIEAFLITEDNLDQIFQKVPLSEKNKMIVLNKGGSLFSHNKKLSTLLESSTLSLKNFKVHLKDIMRIIDYWRNIAPLIVEQKFNEISIQFPHNTLSKLLINQIKKEITNINAVTKYQLSLKNEELNGNLVMKIRPSAFSTEFYTRTILSMNQSIKYTPYIFYFECRKQEKMKKINNIFQNKNVIFESFMVESEKDWNCIDYVSMSTFLRTIGHMSSQIMDTKISTNKGKAVIRSSIES